MPTLSGVPLHTSLCLTHFCPPLRFRNQFLSTVQTFAVRETDVSRHNGGTSGDTLKPLRDDSALRPLSSLRGLRGASRTAYILTVHVCKNWFQKRNGGQKWVKENIVKVVATV